VLTDTSNRTMQEKGPGRGGPPRGGPPPPRRRSRTPPRRQYGDLRPSRYDRGGDHYTPNRREFDDREYNDRPSSAGYDPYRREPPPSSRYERGGSDMYKPQHASTAGRDFRDIYNPPPYDSHRGYSPPPIARGHDRLYERRRRSPPPYARRYDDRRDDRRGYSPRREYDRRTPPRPYRGEYDRGHSHRSPPRRMRSRSPRREDPRREDPRDAGGLKKGTIVRIHERGYGFIKDDKNPEKDWFFPAKEVQGREITELEVGDEVVFKLGRDHRSGKWEAQEVCVQKEEWMEGRIARLKDNFGFIQVGEESIYFHGRHVLRGTFQELSLDVQVSFLSVPSRSRPGTREAQQVSIIESES